MAINFPSAPDTGDAYIDGNLKWIYNGSAWDSFYQPSAPAQVGLGNVDNTSDEDKPVSTAQQAALDALTKDDVGLDNVDNTSDINKPVSTAQQAAIDAAGGSSFDQDLNTTDSPTFATLNTTDTIATDVYAVDVSASGTVTAGKGLFNTPTVGGQYALEVQSNSTKNFTIDGYGTTESKTLLPRSANVFNMGASNRRWKEAFIKDLDATGTVKKGVYTVATLPTGEAGMTCFVSDANTTTRGSTAAGGGANFMPVYSDGTNWIIS